MSAPLLTTKFYIARTAADAMPRPRLTAKLDAGVGRRLTLVSAPAGFGKTTLLSEWAAGSGRPVAWLSLDGSDNDPVQFWLYFVGALQRLEPHIGGSAEKLLGSVPEPPVRSVLTSLMNEIAESSQECILVLDDYHVITNRAISDDLVFLIEHAPANMHLLIAGRADPPLPLSRLRANNELLEVRADDLRFTLEEVEGLLQGLAVAGLAQEEVSALVARTEGWIVGLQMAALSMKGRKDSSRFVASFGGSNRYVLDYLTDEVLDRQEEDVRSFLLQTSVLERLSGSLCDSVTGRGDGQHMLERLEAANLFVTPLDDERRWYRYHQLFADLLRNQLEKARPGLREVLSQRASVWFEKEDLVLEAVEYALAGNDPERAAVLGESAALGLVVQNRAATVVEWIFRIPEDVLDRHPRLCVAGAWASLALRRFDDVKRLVRQASVRLPQHESEVTRPVDRSLYFHVLTLRAFLARFSGDFAGSIELALKADAHAQEADPIAVGTATLNLAVSQWNSGDLQRAREHAERAYRQAREADNYWCTLTSMGYWAEIEAQLGHLGAAVSICEEAIRLGTDWGMGDLFPTTGYALVALSKVLMEWNRLADAEAALAQGLRLGEAGTESELLVRAYLARARLEEIAGNHDGAAQAFAKAYAVKNVFPYLSRQISAWEAQWWLSQGRSDQAVRWAEEQELPLESEAHLDSLEELQRLTVLRIKLATGAAQEVLAPLESLRASMEAQERTSGAIEVLNLRALALGQLGRTDEAMVALQRALRLAEPERFIRIFVDEGAAMQQLLRYAERQGMCRDYARSLLRAFLPGEQPAGAVADMFNEQELAILRLMSSGLSNRDIGSQLYLSLNTVKWYSSQIYRKLEVGSRAEAVKRAADLSIL